MILVAMGVSGAGKTTIASALATRLGWTFADGDAFHDAANIEKMHAGVPLTDLDRMPWLKRIAEWIDERRAAGEDAIIACSALKRRYRDVLAKDRPDVHILYLHASRELIASRLHKRTGHFMPEALLDSQFADLEEPARDEHPIRIDVEPPVEAIVDDIVGRLASLRRPSPP